MAGKQSPSTGLLAIGLALGACDRVSLYGFGRAGGAAGGAVKAAPARCKHYWECPRWEGEAEYYDLFHTFHDWPAEERLRELCGGGHSPL